MRLPWYKTLDIHDWLGYNYWGMFYLSYGHSERTYSGSYRKGKPGETVYDEPTDVLDATVAEPKAQGFPRQGDLCASLG